MKTEDFASEEVVVVRLYMAGSVERRDLLFRRLQHWEKLPGATVLQAEHGFGPHGTASGSAAPTVVEFFASEEAVNRVIHDIRALVDHIVLWPARSVIMDQD